MTTVGIAADFDPPHKGHEYLLRKADELGDKILVFLNADYTAHHTPPLLPYELRKEILEDLGVDRVIPVRGYHQRFPLAYSVPPRLRTMIEEGVDVVLDAGPEDPERLREHAEKVLATGDLFSVPDNIPGRNVVRWLAAAMFLEKTTGRRIELELIPELEGYSGRAIRARLRRDGYSPRAVYGVRRHLPEETFIILKRYLKDEKPPIADRKELIRTVNEAPPHELINAPHVSTIAARELLKGRPFKSERQLWGALKRAGYGSVLTRLTLANIEAQVETREITDTAAHWTTERTLPPAQHPTHFYRRDWFVAKLSSQGVKARHADSIYRTAPDYTKAAEEAERRYGLNPGEPNPEPRIGSCRAPDGTYAPAVSENGTLTITDGRHTYTPRLTRFGATLLRYVLDDPFVHAVTEVRGGKIHLIVHTGGEPPREVSSSNSTRGTCTASPTSSGP